MDRESLLLALAQLNDAIASLNVRLHPPPADPDDRAELETELVAAEHSREVVEQALANLPQPEAAPSFGIAAMITVQRAKAQTQAAIEMSKLVRAMADNATLMFVEPVGGPTASGGVKTKPAGGKARRIVEGGITGGGGTGLE